MNDPEHNQKDGSDESAEVARPRGFAALSPERRAEIARLGGRTVQAQGRGHRYTAETARAAGLKSQAQARAKRSSEAA